MKKRVWSLCSRIVSIALISTLLLPLAKPINVEARSTKNLTPTTGLTYEIEEIEEGGIVTLSKTGKYKIVVSKDQYGNYIGYLKFVAPKTKKYQFTFGPVKGTKKDFIFGSVQGIWPNTSTTNRTPVFKLKKGKNSCIDIATKKYSNCEKKRVGSLKLKKGSVLYLYFEFHEGTKSRVCNVNLDIR